MNIQSIAVPNTKGQIVIPQGIRKALSISPKSALRITVRGKGIFLYPIEEVITRADRESSYVYLLKKTQGSWSGDDWHLTRKRRKKIETTASKKRKTSW